MRIIAKAALERFWRREPDSKRPLQVWYSICKKTDFDNFAQLKQTFRSVDKVGKFVVFDIGGNKYRLVAHVHFNTAKIYIHAVLTHAEYDTGYWKRE
jgi:mRNA interferase HigB